MTSSHQTNTFSGLEFGAKILGISGLLYGIGLVAINLSFFFWGFYDFEVPNQQAVYAGVWTFIFIALACLPAAIANIVPWDRWRYRLYTQRWGRFILERCLKPQVGIPFALLLIASVMLPAHLLRTHIQAVLQNSHVASLRTILALQAVALGWMFFSFTPEIDKLLSSDRRKVTPGNFLCGAIFPLFLAHGLLLIFVCIYIQIPVSMGGGMPIL